MGQVPLYGVTDAPQFDFLAFARVIFAAQQGTILELGIGPIVTGRASNDKGSDILKLNFKNPDDRAILLSATLVTIIVIIAEGGILVLVFTAPFVASPSYTYVLITTIDIY